MQAQITLTDAENEILRGMAQRTGKTQDELLHEAIKLLAQPEQEDRLNLLRQARGIWKGRDDLPELRERDEFDRF